MNHKYQNGVNFRRAEPPFPYLCFSFDFLKIFNHVLISLSIFLINNFILGNFFRSLLSVTCHYERMFPCEYFMWQNSKNRNKHWNVLTIISRNDEMPGGSPPFVFEPLHLMMGSIALLCVPGAEVNPVLPTPIQAKAVVNNIS